MSRVSGASAAAGTVGNAAADVASRGSVSGVSEDGLSPPQPAASVAAAAANASLAPRKAADLGGIMQAVYERLAL